MTEQGIIWSSLLAAIGIFALWTSFKIIKDNKSSMRLKLLVLALISSLFGGIVCGMGSTCFDISCIRDLLSGSDLSMNAFMQSSLLLLACILIVAMLFFGFISKGKLVRNAVLSYVVATLLCLLVLAVGCFHDLQCKVLHTKDGATWLKLKQDKNKGGLLLLPDQNSCERKALLKFFKEKYPDNNIIMPLHSNYDAMNLDTEFDTIVLCGNNINTRLNSSKNIILYLPDAMPSKNALPGEIKKIYLSTYDEKGANASWEDSYESAKIIEYLE
jgi:hypothetical protein